jgi:hypothetical protein
MGFWNIENIFTSPVDLTCHQHRREERLTPQLAYLLSLLCSYIIVTILIRFFLLCHDI